MHVTLLHPDDLGEADRDAWQAMRAADPRYASPFLSPAFAQAAGRVRDDARVLVSRGTEEQVDLILPIQIARSGFARPLGAPMCDVNGAIAASAGSADGLARVLADAGVSAYAFSGWRDAPTASGVKRRLREGSFVADLSQGFDAYLETQREIFPKHFKKMRRLARQAERDFGDVTFSLGAASDEELATLIAWKRQQFLRTRRHDVLKADWTRGLLHICAQARDSDFAGVMATLRIGGRLAAMEFGLRSGAVLHGWIAGYASDFAPYSPGLILQERLLEAAAADGVAEVLLGTGETHYKKYYGSWMCGVDEGLVISNGLAGRARAITGRLLNGLEHSALGPASRLATRTRRRLDIILAVETRIGEQMRGFVRAVGEEPSVRKTGAALSALTRVTSA